MRFKNGFIACLFFLCNYACIAQEFLTFNLIDQTNKPIPFSTLENIKARNIKFFSDSLGKVNLPKVIGMSYKIHALGFCDTIITIQDNVDFFIKMKSNNLLEEVVVVPTKRFSKLEKLRSSRANQFNWYASGNATYNHEIGRIISINKDIWLQTVSFKLKSKYEINFKNSIFVSIYKVNQKLEDALDLLRKKKPWTYSLPPPNLVYSSHLNDEYSVIYKENLLIFDLSKQSIYIQPGTYIVAMEMMAKTTLGIQPYFNLQKECFTLRSNNNSKVVAWFTDFWEDKYMNIIVDLSYFSNQ